MRVRIAAWLAAFLVMALPAMAQAQVTREQRFALFKRTMSPTWVRGANGYLTAPNALTIGNAKLAAGAWVQHSGEVDPPGPATTGEVYTNTVSAFFGLTEDFEVGVTRKFLTHGDQSTTGLNMQANMLHLKARVLKLAEPLPAIGIGANAFEVTDNDFQGKESFVDLYVVATETIKLGPLWLNGSLGLQAGFQGTKKSDNLAFAAVQVNLSRHFLVGAEVVGANKELAQAGNVRLGTDAILNLTTAVNIPLGTSVDLQLGVDAYNVGKSISGSNLPAEAEERELGGHMSITILFGGE